MIDLYSTEEDLFRCAHASLKIDLTVSDAETAAVSVPRIVKEYVEKSCEQCVYENFYEDLQQYADINYGQYFWPVYITACVDKSPEIIVEIFRRSIRKESRIDDSLFLYLLAYGVNCKRSTEEDVILSTLMYQIDWSAATAGQWRRVRLLLDAVQLRNISWEKWLNFVAVRCAEDEYSLREYSLLLMNFGSKHMWPTNAKDIAYSDTRVVQISLNLSRIQPPSARTEVIDSQPVCLRSSLHYVYTLSI